MIVGTVLFQSSSYGKEGKLLCCVGEGASEPGVSGFAGMMLRDVMLCHPRPVSLRVLQGGCGSFQVCLCPVVRDQPWAGLRLPAFIWVLGLLE